MGLLSSTVSVTRYKVEGKLEDPILDTIAKGLKENVIKDVDEDISEKKVGWTSFENPFMPDFRGSSFVIGTHMVFSLRIDKKAIPQKIIRKHYAIESAKRLAESGRQFLTRDEKKMIKDHVTDTLMLRIPSTPHLYDLIWDYDSSSLCFFSNLKSANEELETLFSQSFQLSLIRLFPFTIADLTMGLSDPERDNLEKLSPTNFTG
ncbi:MAG: exonuclease [Deltaproteobacteria bacterium]|jgi:DNA recombination-dependent growth factor C|nr:MAG: exonuclease [Deltaproteobacteria bacterium]